MRSISKIRWYHKFAIVAFCVVGALLLTAQNYSNIGGNVSAAISALLGTSQGLAMVGGSSGAINVNGSVNAIAFKSTTANSPCLAIQAAIATLPQNTNVYAGGVVDASSLGDGTGAFSNFTNKGCGLDSNIFGGPSGGQAAVSQLRSGQLQLGSYQLNVSLVPSQYGTCLENNTCAAGATMPQIPPAAVMFVPTGTIGLIGRGRGFGGTRGTTIHVCSAADVATFPGCIAPLTRSWSIASITVDNTLSLTNQRISGAVHRKYMTITATPNSIPITSIVGNGTTATVTMASNIAGQLSGGQTFGTDAGNTLAGFQNLAGQTVCAKASQPTGCAAGAVAPKTINGVTVFTFASATNGTGTGGNLQLGMNFTPGEYIQLQNVAGSGTSVDDGTWRVCASNAATNNSTSFDTHCTSDPSATSVTVVGTSADNSPQLHAADVVACAATCGGNIVGAIPVIDIGDPDSPATSTVGAQFASQVQYLTIECNNVASCAGIRNITGNEQSGASFWSVTASQMWGLIAYSTVGQNSFAWHDFEVLDVNGMTCFPGTAAIVMADNGIRNMYGFTGNWAACAGSFKPDVGFYDDSNSSSVIGTGHFENVKIGVLCGQNQVCQGQIFTGIGGPPAAVTTTDGPYQTTVTTAHAVSGNFPSQINGANSPFTGDYCFFEEKRSSSVSAVVNTMTDDYFNYTTNDPLIGMNCVDTAATATFPAHIISSTTVPSVYQTIGIASVCGAASSATPACGAAASGAFAVPATTTSIVVATTAVTATSKIFLQPTTDNTGITGAPACTIPTITADPVTTARVAGTSFTFAITSSGLTCWQYWIID